MLVSDFMSLFVKRLYEDVPEEVKRDLVKQDRTIKHVLHRIMSDYHRLRKELASPFQEKFHLRMDQLAADYRTWKRAGCKSYARPKQYVSGHVAGLSKKAFDYTLGVYLIDLKHQGKEKVVPISTNEEKDHFFDEFSEEAI